MVSPNKMNGDFPMPNESNLKRHVDSEYDLINSEIALVIKDFFFKVKDMAL